MVTSSIRKIIQHFDGIPHVATWEHTGGNNWAVQIRSIWLPQDTHLVITRDDGPFPEFDYGRVDIWGYAVGHYTSSDISLDAFGNDASEAIVREVAGNEDALIAAVEEYLELSRVALR
jgi:hypothetical protein